MNKNSLLNLIAIFFILGVTTLPAIVGPMLNIGQFMGGEYRFLPLLKKGIVPMLSGGLIGFLFLRLLINRIQHIDFENKWKTFLEGSLFIYFPLILAWTFCQVTALIIENSFFNGLSGTWYDAVFSIPVLIWFALFPCAIASLCFGLVLMLTLKKK